MLVGIVRWSRSTGFCRIFRGNPSVHAVPVTLADQQLIGPRLLKSLQTRLRELLSTSSRVERRLPSTCRYIIPYRSAEIVRLLTLQYANRETRPFFLYAQVGPAFQS